jgi:cytoskeletal protein CcmA (bactofilin family)
VTGTSDRSVDGEVVGQIELPGYVLTLGTHARITAPIIARRVHIAGEVAGDVSATEAIVLESTASIQGDIVAPAVAIAAGARFAGSIDMRTHAPEQSRAIRLTPCVPIAV